ncbi:MAG TPA: Gfo/Idh/MocA family oxidoreductase [Myxococcota bacterium]|nr:Gfo/Idh/MocA family oxidoreductase [Myxococcota bacterium]HOD06711.1 Gfo/Idh/MocA family oxidoreductase [Myxococcota bacterium]HPB50027.1 Gfo/Idh/MocA family oxidoreductase [Myxococcota bacterium]HQP94601.1 Gfo/Idh/MocA family oxidoreductase [Myxococcota bacterium]
MGSSRIRFGIVGCGRISGFHIDAIMSCPESAVVAAVCDIDPARAREAAARAGGVPFFNDLGTMLAHGGLDCVSICTPSGLHPEHGMMAAAAGCHVVCEKPVGTDLESIDRLIETCRANDRLLFTVLQNRFNPTVALTRQAIDKGRFGRLLFAQANVFWTRPQEYYDQASWRGSLALDGGAFMNQASHYVDLVQWIMGQPVEVSAIAGTLARRIESPDTGSAAVRFAGGAIASINTTMLVYPANLEGSLTLMGTTGTVRIGGIALNRITTWDFADVDAMDAGVKDSGYVPPTVYGHGHTGYYRRVISAINGGNAECPDGVEGRKSVRLILAIGQASGEGRSVRLQAGQ